MKKLLSLVILLVATTCFATEQLVFLSGDSEEAIMSTQLPPPENGVVYTELATAFVPSPLDEIFPGDWVGNGAMAAYHSILPDRAAFALGCNNGDTPLNGGRFKGDRNGFLRAMQSVVGVQLQDGDPLIGEGNYRARTPYDQHDRKQIRDDLDPWESFQHPKQTTLKRGDVLHLWIQGTGGMAEIDGIEVPCFYLAWGSVPIPPVCETFGGDLLIPSYTGDNPHILGLRQVVEAIEGQGTVVIYLVFARAGAWTAYLDDYIVWAGCEANEYVYICNTDAENSMFWPGFAEDNFLLIEPTIRIANAWIGYRNSDGAWSPEDYDLNDDHHIWFSEACNAAEILDDQHGTAINVPVGKDFRIWSMYPDDDPLGGGGGSPPAPEIYPNPFNPIAEIRIELQSAGVLEVSVFNILGRRVVQLTNGKRSAGLHSFTFDGSQLPSGIYFMQTVFNGRTSVKKMVLQK